jgi:aspartyl/asparaginyl beta-hydroxylase (cupin superfamily)
MCKEDRHVLLLVDNASSHMDFNLSHVKIHFLPPNTTAELQPLDAGIIRSFKAHYRRFFLKWVLTQIETETGVQNMDLLTCISLILRAWNQVSETTIRNC